MALRVERRRRERRREPPPAAPAAAPGWGGFNRSIAASMRARFAGVNPGCISILLNTIIVLSIIPDRRSPKGNDNAYSIGSIPYAGLSEKKWLMY